MVSIKQVKDRFERGLAMAVLENFDEGILRGSLLKTQRNLDWAMVRIVVADESSDETDKYVSGGLRIADDSAFGCKDRGSHSYEQEEHRD
jgi:hypothetical protein